MSELKVKIRAFSGLRLLRVRTTSTTPKVSHFRWPQFLDFWTG
jgi:hypothetical protein